MKIVEYPDRDMMAIDLAQTLAGELNATLMHEDHATFVVPGGTTPAPVFDALCAADLEWDRINVMLSDERWVPSDHPRSNTRLLHDHLLVGPAAAAHVLPMYAPAEEPELAIGQLTQLIRPHLPISVALLGMGADMHTASLFPDAENLSLALASDAPVLVPMRPKGQPEARVTLSARVLQEALSLHIVATGSDKRAALEKAWGLSPEEAPVAAVLENAIVHWVE